MKFTNSLSLLKAHRLKTLGSWKKSVNPLSSSMKNLRNTKFTRNKKKRKKKRKSRIKIRFGIPEKKSLSKLTKP